MFINAARCWRWTVAKSPPKPRSPAADSRRSGSDATRNDSDAAKTSQQTNGQNSDGAIRTGAVTTYQQLSHCQLLGYY